MDGYHQEAGGGEFVTYERLRTMGTNGFQEPATGFADGKIVGTKRLYTDGKFGTEDGKATFMATEWRGLQAPGKQAAEGQVPLPDQQRPRQHRLAVGLSRPGERLRHGPLAASVPPDAPRRHGRARRRRGRSGRGLERRRLDPGDGLADADGASAKETFMLFAYPDRRAGQRGQRRRQRVRHPELQADLGQHPPARRASRSRSRTSPSSRRNTRPSDDESVPARATARRPGRRPVPAERVRAARPPNVLTPRCGVASLVRARARAIAQRIATPTRLTAASTASVPIVKSAPNRTIRTAPTDGARACAIRLGIARRPISTA